MEKYKRIPKQREATERIGENEIRITSQGKPRNFISYATNIFQENKSDTIILKAMGRAINKTVTVAEIVKRRIADLHQITEIGSTQIVDVWEPIDTTPEEAAGKRMETKRTVSSITITLSKKPLDSSKPGYQAPIPAELVTAEQPRPPRPPRQPRQPREPREPGQPRRPRAPLAEDGMEPIEPARGRGRGRRRRSGRGRGGRPQGEAPVVATEVAAVATAEGVPARGRGRGRARGRGRGRGRGGRPAGPIPSATPEGQVEGAAAPARRGRRRGGRGRGRGRGGNGNVVNSAPAPVEAAPQQ